MYNVDTIPLYYLGKLWLLVFTRKLINVNFGLHGKLKRDNFSTQFTLTTFNFFRNERPSSASKHLRVLKGHERYTTNSLFEPNF